MRWLALVLALTPWAAVADVLVMARTLPAGTIVTEADLRPDDRARNGISDAGLVVGLETRTTLYEGRAIRASDVTRPTLVDRNQIVKLNWVRGGLVIETDGRALGKGGAGEVIRVMNLASRATVSARINEDGTVEVIGK